MLEGDETGTARVLLRMPVAPRELQAGLDGLRAAVAEECARQPGQIREPCRDFPLQRVKVQVRRVEERRRLIGDGRRKAWMPVSERRHADTREQIEVAAAVGIEQVAAAPALEHHRVALVDLKNVFGLERHHVAGCGRHALSPLLHRAPVRLMRAKAVPGALV